MSADIEVKGLKETETMLVNMPRKLARKAVKTGIRKGIAPIRKHARANAPKDTGRLRRAIKSRVWKRPKKGEYGYKVIIDRGNSRDDPKGAWYGYFVDEGYVKEDGKHVEGKHFMTNAFDSQKDRAADITIKEIERGIDEATR